MPTTSTLVQFAVASTLLAITPGPSVVLLLAVGAERGRRAGVATALGLAVGTAVWALVAAAGLGSLLAARPGLLAAVTVVGGLYLLWLAWARFRAARTTEAAPPAVGDRSALRDGIVVNLLNPSIAIFLASILPPFLAPGVGPFWFQAVVLGGVLVAASTVVNVGYAFLGAAVGRRARRWVGGRATAAVAAAVYAGLGLTALLLAARG